MVGAVGIEPNAGRTFHKSARKGRSPYNRTNIVPNFWPTDGLPPTYPQKQRERADEEKEG